MSHFKVQQLRRARWVMKQWGYCENYSYLTTLIWGWHGDGICLSGYTF